jgi:capsule polysaccharide export protein KpsE/RkpR
MDNLEKLGMEIVGGVAVLVAGWLGIRKANTVATKDSAEAELYSLMQEEIKRMSAQMNQLLNEHQSCTERVQALTQEVASLKQMILLEKQHREAENDGRRKGLILTRKTDSKRG